VLLFISVGAYKQKNTKFLHKSSSGAVVRRPRVETLVQILPVHIFFHFSLSPTFSMISLIRGLFKFIDCDDPHFFTHYIKIVSFIDQDE
jgi:hypothetical protein